MKLVSYKEDSHEQLGLFIDGKIYNLSNTHSGLPSTMGQFLKLGEAAMEAAKEIDESIKNGEIDIEPADATEEDLIAPVPHPTSCRDAYAFRQHVAAARKNRGVEMIPEFDQYPIFYFTNHNATFGPTDEIKCMPDHFHKLDFELESAIVIGKQGKNIPAEEADEYIAGYMILNDISARVLQMEEMKLNLGPAKGKDFCNVIGPWLVTPDELEQYKTSPKEGHTGENYNLQMKCWVNGKQVSEGNMGDMDWTYAEIIERCSYGTDIYPGDVIGSGTVGTGCYLELNGTALRNDPNYEPQWLKDGDVVEMEITGLGKLKNTIKATDNSFSILDKKKEVREPAAQL